MTVHCPTCRTTVRLETDTDLGRIECPACRGVFSLAPAPAGGVPEPAAPSDRPLAKGERLAGYRIEGTIGSGGMGTVYRATQLSLNRPVALKVLAGALGRDADFVKRFEREARTVAALDHPNIVRVIDRGHDGDRYFFAMDLVEGESLRQKMDRGRLGADDALRVAGEVAAALDYAHAQGVLHRDVKPENILLDRTGRVRVADFGLAKILGPATLESAALTRTNLLMGTLEYMAPEARTRSGAPADARSDLYSVGVVLYEMLTGLLPIGRFAPASESGAPGWVDGVLERLLATDPARRVPGAGTLLNLLASAGGGAAGAADLGAADAVEPRRVLGLGPSAPLRVDDTVALMVLVFGAVFAFSGGAGLVPLIAFGGLYALRWIHVPEWEARRRSRWHRDGRGSRALFEIDVRAEGSSEKVNLRTPFGNVRVDGQKKGPGDAPPERSDPFAPSAWKPRRVPIPFWTGGTLLRAILGCVLGAILGTFLVDRLPGSRGDTVGFYAGSLLFLGLLFYGHAGVWRSWGAIWFAYLCLFAASETGIYRSNAGEELAVVGGLASLAALLFMRRRFVEVGPDGISVPVVAPSRPSNPWAVASVALVALLCLGAMSLFLSAGQPEPVRESGPLAPMRAVEPISGELSARQLDEGPFPGEPEGFRTLRGGGGYQFASAVWAFQDRYRAAYGRYADGDQIWTQVFEPFERRPCEEFDLVGDGTSYTLMFDSEESGGRFTFSVCQDAIWAFPGRAEDRSLGLWESRGWTCLARSVPAGEGR